MIYRIFARFRFFSDIKKIAWVVPPESGDVFCLLTFASMTTQKVFFRDLGTMEYQPAWDLQEDLLAENVKIKSIKWNNKNDEVATAEETMHHLLFVEHPPVYTLGKSGKMDNVLISEEERQKKNVGFF